MTKVSTNISLDPVLKKNAQELLKDLGMNLSTAIIIFLIHQSIILRHIHKSLLQNF